MFKITSLVSAICIFVVSTSSAPVPQSYDIETNLVEVGPEEKNLEQTLSELPIQNTSEPTEPDNEEYFELQDLIPTTSTQSPLQTSMNNFITSLTSSVRGLLTNTQHGLLRAIGSVDKTVANVQNALENSTFSLVLEGQKAAARVYDETPQSVNKLIQRVGTVRDNRMFSQLSDVINQWRDNRKKLYEMLHEHELDWHDVFQDAFSTANKHLGVKDLPRIQMGWYHNRS